MDIGLTGRLVVARQSVSNFVLMTFNVHYFTVEAVKENFPSYMVPCIMYLLFEINESLVVCDHCEMTVSSQLIYPLAEGFLYA